MRILVTGNPNYEGLCKGIYEAYNRNFVEFIGRWNGWDLSDYDKVADYAKNYEVFVNSQYGPDGEQIELFNQVYNKFEEGHIINISSTSAYWNNGPKQYVNNKKMLDFISKEKSQIACWGNTPIRVSNIAFGQLSSKTQEQRDSKNKISLEEAGKLVKWVIDSPRSMNFHYLAVDPIQRDQ
jgi:NAD(P)-dependent dehydrogenase (short-subunit alcohol dehydrogenase family)